MQCDLLVVMKRVIEGDESLIQQTDLSNLVIPNLTAQLAVAPQAVIAETLQNSKWVQYTPLCMTGVYLQSQQGWRATHVTTSPCFRSAGL